MGSDPRATVPPINSGGVNWRRNLAALWFAEFTAIFGFSFAFPFLSIFINQDLGVGTGSDLYLWTAASASASGIALAVASPVWGVLGDRFGRKPMLVRSMVGGALFVGLIYFVQNPTQLVILRFLQGLTSGTVAAATALVAAETPRPRIGWALGVVTSAVALGGAIGPVIGGFAGAVFGLRVVFLVSGGLLLLAVIPVFLLVRETPILRTGGARVGALALINQQAGQRHALTVLIAAQGLVSLVTSGAQQLLVLRLLEMVQTGVAFVSGIAFGLAGLATSLAAIGYTRFSQRLGYVKTAAAASGLLALAVLLTGAAPTSFVVVVAAALTGLFGGVVLPATASMLGLETPHQAQSTVFGINASSVAMGFFLGPLIGGTVAAATSDVSSALYVIAGLSMALAALLSTQAREPAR